MRVTGNESLVSWAPLEVVELRHKRRDSALAQLAATAQRGGLVSDPALLIALLQRAHRLGSCAVGRGYAVPNARSIVVMRSGAVFGRSARGIDWGAEGEEPVHLVLMVLSPTTIAPGQHVERVTGAVHALRLQRMRHKLLEAECSEALVLLAGAAE